MNKRFIHHISFLFIALFLLVSCGVHYIINEKRTRAIVIALDSASAPVEDSASLAIIAPYRDSMQKQMDEILGYSEHWMVKDKPEGMLNNFVADLVLSAANQSYSATGGSTVEMCVLNSGGFRGSLPKGAILLRNVYEMMPFENKICVLTVTGSNTRRMLDFIAHEGGLPVAGIKMGIKNEKAVNVLINSVPFDSTRNYIIATSDYLAAGGDKYGFLLNPVKRVDLDAKVRDVVAGYLRNLTLEGKTVDVKLDNRIYYEK
jgi:2',3'-cyclic-nucleotide 2'-phosphodiesterase (5'-nucleotidase family)